VNFFQTDDHEGMCGPCKGTLRKRVARAADKKLRQPSLFDGIERIDPKFRPTRSRGTNRAMKVLRDWFSRWLASPTYRQAVDA